MKVRNSFLALLCALLLVMGCGGDGGDSAGNDDGSNSGTADAGSEGSGDEAPIKIGVLHSLSGTMAISEASLKDAVELAVEEINA